MNKAQGYIGLAKKAGAIEIGETNTGAAIRAGKGRILILAADASDNAKRRAESFIHGTQTPMAVLPFTKAELSQMTGEGGCSMAVFTDVGLAAAFMEELAENEPAYKEAADLLAQKSAKAQLRKRETLAHEKNLKKGKAVSSADSVKRRRNV